MVVTFAPIPPFKIKNKRFVKQSKDYLTGKPGNYYTQARTLNVVLARPKAKRMYMALMTTPSGVGFGPATGAVSPVESAQIPRAETVEVGARIPGLPKTPPDYTERSFQLVSPDSLNTLSVSLGSRWLQPQLVYPSGVPADRYYLSSRQDSIHAAMPGVNFIPGWAIWSPESRHFALVDPKVLENFFPENADSIVIYRSSIVDSDFTITPTSTKFNFPWSTTTDLTLDNSSAIQSAAHEQELRVVGLGVAGFNAASPDRGVFEIVAEHLLTGRLYVAECICSWTSAGLGDSAGAKALQLISNGLPQWIQSLSPCNGSNRGGIEP